MPSRRPAGIRRPVAGRFDKALPSMPAGLTPTTTQGDAINALLARQAFTQQQGIARPLPRDTYPYAFGPGVPLVPTPIDPVRPDTGRAEPRFSEYPESWNLPGVGTKHVPWWMLRKAADMPVISDCLRIRKDEISTMPWEIRVARRAVAETQRSQPGTSRRSAEAQMREQLMPEIQRCTTWWKEPDRGNGETFDQWITKFLDERMVLDAVAIYPRPDYSGDLHSFEILDGSTIKPLRDSRGGRPQPPLVAYQSILYGFPRSEFEADTSDLVADGTNGLMADQLIYLRRDVRSYTPYGRSNVEGALVELDMLMHRNAWMRAEFTDGVTPSGWLVNRQVQQGNTSTMWSPAQVMEYETALNDLMAGDTANRHRLRIPPPGWEPVLTPDVAEKFRPDYDLHLIKMLVMHLETTVHELGFTEAKGLGSSGHAEGQARLQERKSSTPTLRAVQAILSRLSVRYLDMPDVLEFHFLGVDEDDEDQPEPLGDLVAQGLMTWNEARDEQGRPRYDIPEADQPAIVGMQTGTITFLEGSSEPPPAPPPPMMLPGMHPPVPPEEQDDGDKPPPPAAGPDGADKAAELRAYRRWARQPSARKFALTCTWLPGELTDAGIDPTRVEFSTKAADADPKVRIGPPGTTTSE